MSAAIVIAILAVVALSALFVVTTTARRDRRRAVGAHAERSPAIGDVAPEMEAPSGRAVERAAVLEWRGGTGVAVAKPAPPAPRAPIEPEALSVTRRQFFNRGIVTLFSLGLGSFGAASLGFLWPTLSGGFGSKIRVGKLDEILEQIAQKREPFYVAEARSWIAPYPKDAVRAAGAIYTGGVLEGMKSGLVALYQKCPHLGCRVPWCKSSQWFECPCHGSQYNRVGEKKAGPAPRGMDRFAVSVDGGTVVVDTGEIIQGPSIGVNTTGQEAEGPHCA